MTLRIAYLFRGFLADLKYDKHGTEVSTPDGNATYSWSIDHECFRRKHRLIPLGENLDEFAAGTLGEAAFSAFSGDKRAKSYERMLKRGWSKLSDKKFPDVDLVLIEWRWPIPGRNTSADIGSLHYQPDLERQEQVLRHYSSKGTPIIVWDLDHKLTAEDEARWSLTNVIETSVAPRKLLVRRTRVEPPTIVADMLQWPLDTRMPTHHMGYVGSRYERDETIDKWIGSITPPATHRAKFWGKWEPLQECEARWPGINFGARIATKDFRGAYSRCAVVPLLAKQSYYDCGFITPRPWEAVLFGATTSVGLHGHLGIGQYTNHVARDPEHLLEISRELRTLSSMRRVVIREEAAHKLNHTDARHFVDVLEAYASGMAETASKTV